MSLRSKLLLCAFGLSTLFAGSHAWYDWYRLGVRDTRPLPPEAIAKLGLKEFEEFARAAHMSHVLASPSEWPWRRERKPSVRANVGLPSSRLDPALVIALAQFLGDPSCVNSWHTLASEQKSDVGNFLTAVETRAKDWRGLFRSIFKAYGKIPSGTTRLDSSRFEAAVVEATKEENAALDHHEVLELVRTAKACGAPLDRVLRYVASIGVLARTRLVPATRAFGPALADALSRVDPGLPATQREALAAISAVLETIDYLDRRIAARDPFALRALGVRARATWFFFDDYRLQPTDAPELAKRLAGHNEEISEWVRWIENRRTIRLRTDDLVLRGVFRTADTKASNDVARRRIAEVGLLEQAGRSGDGAARSYYGPPGALCLRNGLGTSVTLAQLGLILPAATISDLDFSGGLPPSSRLPGDAELHLGSIEALVRWLQTSVTVDGGHIAWSAIPLDDAVFALKPGQILRIKVLDLPVDIRLRGKKAVTGFLDVDKASALTQAIKDRIAVVVRSSLRNSVAVTADQVALGADGSFLVGAPVLDDSEGGEGRPRVKEVLQIRGTTKDGSVRVMANDLPKEAAAFLLRDRLANEIHELKQEFEPDLGAAEFRELLHDERATTSADALTRRLRPILNEVPPTRRTAVREAALRLAEIGATQRALVAGELDSVVLELNPVTDGVQATCAVAGPVREALEGARDSLELGQQLRDTVATQADRVPTRTADDATELLEALMFSTIYNRIAMLRRTAQGLSTTELPDSNRQGLAESLDELEARCNTLIAATAKDAPRIEQAFQGIRDEFEALVNAAGDKASEHLQAALHEVDTAEKGLTEMLAEPRDAATTLKQWIREAATELNGTRYLVLPFRESGHPSMLVAWRKQNRTLDRNRLVITERLTSPTNEFAYPGRTIAVTTGVGDLKITASALTDGTPFALTLPGPKPRQAERLRRLAEELCAKTALVEVAGKTGSRSWKAVGRVESGHFIPVSLEIEGRPYHELLVDLVPDEEMREALHIVLQARMAHVEFRPIPISEFLDHGLVADVVGRTLADAQTVGQTIDGLPLRLTVPAAELEILKGRLDEGLRRALRKIAAGFPGLVEVGPKGLIVDFGSGELHLPVTGRMFATRDGNGTATEEVVARLRGPFDPSPLSKLLALPPLEGALKPVENSGRFLVSVEGEKGRLSHRLLLTARLRSTTDGQEYPLNVVVPGNGRDARIWLQRGACSALGGILESRLKAQLNQFLQGHGVTVLMQRAEQLNESIEKFAARVKAKRADLENWIANFGIEAQVEITVSVAGRLLRIDGTATARMAGGSLQWTLDGSIGAGDLKDLLKPLRNLNIVKSIVDSRVSFTLDDGSDPRLIATFERILIGSTPLSVTLGRGNRFHPSSATKEALLAELINAKAAVLDRMVNRLQSFARSVLPIATDLEADLHRAGQTLELHLKYGNNPPQKLQLELGWDGVRIPTDKQLLELAFALVAHAEQGKFDDYLKKLGSVCFFGIELQIDVSGAVVTPNSVTFSASISRDFGGDIGPQTLELRGIRIGTEGRIDFGDIKFDTLVLKSVLRAKFGEYIDDLGIPKIGVAFRDTDVDVSGGSVRISTRPFLLRKLFEKLHLRKVAERIPVNGIPMGTAEVRFADGKLSLEFGESDPTAIVSEIVAQEILRHSPIEILGRKVIIDELRYEDRKVFSTVRVVEEGDVAMELVGHMTINTRASSIENAVNFSLDFDNTAIQTLQAWLSRYIPSTPFLSVTVHKIDPRELSILFGFQSEILGISIGLDGIQLQKGKISFPNGAKLDFSSPLRIQLGTSPFMLVNPGGSLDLESKDVAIRATLTASGPKTESIFAIEGTVATNLRRPTRLSGKGTLTLVTFLEAGETQSELQLERGLMTAGMTMGRPELVGLSGTGRLQVPGFTAPWSMTMNADATVLGLELAQAAIEASNSGLHANCYAKLLGARAEANFRSTWKFEDTHLNAKCSIDIEIAGVDVQVKSDRKEIRVKAHATAPLVDVRLDFDIPAWAGLNPALIAAMVAEAILPKGIKISGNPLDALKDLDGIPKLRIKSGKIDIKFGGSGGDDSGEDGDGDSEEGEPGEGESTTENASEATAAAEKAAASVADAASDGDAAVYQANAAVSAAADAAKAVSKAALATAPAKNSPPPDGASPEQKAVAAAQQAQAAATHADELLDAVENADAMADAMGIVANAMRELEQRLAETADAEQDPNLAAALKDRAAAAAQARSQAEQREEEIREAIRDAKQELAERIKAKHSTAKTADRLEDDASANANSTPAGSTDSTEQTGESLNGDRNSAVPPHDPPSAAPAQTAANEATMVAMAKAKCAFPNRRSPDLEKQLTICESGLAGNVLIVAGRIFYESASGRLSTPTKVSDFLRNPAGKNFVKFLVHSLVRFEGSEGSEAVLLKGPDSQWGSTYEHAFVVSALAELNRRWKVPSKNNAPKEFDKLYNKLGITNVGRKLDAVLAMMIRALRNGQAQTGRNAGSWDYRGWTNSQGNDLSLTQAALFGIRSGLMDSNGLVDTALVRRAFGSDGLTSWQDLSNTVARARTYANSCYDPNRKIFAADSSKAGASFSGGALLALVPLGTPSLPPDKLPAQLYKVNLAKIEDVVRQVLVDGKELSNKIQVKKKPFSAPFETHYRLLYVFRGLQAYRRFAKIGAIPDDVWASYQSLICVLADKYDALRLMQSPYGTPKESTWVQANAPHIALATLVHAMILDEAQALVRGAASRINRKKK